MRVEVRRDFIGAGLGETAIGVVTGDDVLERVARWIADGVDLSHLENGAALSTVSSRLVAANVYFGARPIAGAILSGSQIVVTGRVADASLTLGPAAAHFGWGWDDWPKLAGASVAGHLIECGAQATGGLWNGWKELPDFAGIGYPIVEVAPEGSCVITKPEGTGGRVSRETVIEQLLYEIDDPARYHTPDVDVDFTTVSLEDVGPDRVAVTGSTGRPPSDRLKVVAVYRDGWTASGMLAVVGRDAESKARAAGRLSSSECVAPASRSPILWWNALARGTWLQAFFVRPRLPLRWYYASRFATRAGRRSTGFVASSRHWSLRGRRASPAMPPAVLRLDRRLATGRHLCPALAEAETRVEVRTAAEWAKALRESRKS